jgi:hypothetical protein
MVTSGLVERPARGASSAGRSARRADPARRSTTDMESAIGLLLIVISLVEIVGIIRVVGKNTVG